MPALQDGLFRLPFALNSDWQRIAAKISANI